MNFLILGSELSDAFSPLSNLCSCSAPSGSLTILSERFYSWQYRGPLRSFLMGYQSLPKRWSNWTAISYTTCCSTLTSWKTVCYLRKISTGPTSCDFLGKAHRCQHFRRNFIDCVLINGHLQLLSNCRFSCCQGVYQVVADLAKFRLSRCHWSKYYLFKKAHRCCPHKSLLDWVETTVERSRSI